MLESFLLFSFAIFRMKRTLVMSASRGTCHGPASIGREASAQLTGGLLDFLVSYTYSSGMELQLALWLALCMP